jgi:hypothetical protein
MLPPFFSEYLRLHWTDHPDLEAITTKPHLYAIHNFISIQGQKDTGRLWYHLFKRAFESIGLHRSVADHAVFVWKERESEMFIAVVTDDCLCLVENRAQFLRHGRIV